MSKNEISLDEAVLLINKLIKESIPVVGFFVSVGGVQVKLRGFASSATTEAGLIIVDEQPSPRRSYLAVPMGNPFGVGCKFVFGDKRELREDVREEYAATLGEAALSISLPDGTRLNLFFTP